MLNVMRDNLRQLKWVLWVVAISLVLYLGAYVSCDPGGGGVDAPWAARVDGSPISREDLQRRARALDQSYRRQFGQQYEQFRAQLRIGTQALEGLIQRRIILNEAAGLGLAASPEEVSRAILENPGFKGPDGQFIGRERYASLVSRIGGVEVFERSLAEDIVVQKWIDLVASPIAVDDEELFEIYKERNDRAELDYVVVASADQDVDTKVSDEELQAWYDSHQDDFRREEGRRVRYVVLRRADELERLQITDDDIAAYYADNQAQFTRPEERRARHILIKTDPAGGPDAAEQARAQAESLLARLQAGSATFEELASEHSADPQSAAQGGDLGFFGRGAMVPEFDQAVFETPVGSLAEVVQTSYGFHVIEVTDERPAGVTPLPEVREDIERQLRQTGAERAVEQRAAALATEIGSADSLESVASREGLEVQELVVRRGTRMSELGAEPGLVERLFSLETGAATDAVRVREGRAILAVTGVVEADIAPLDEVRGPVTAAVLNDRALSTAIELALDAASSHSGLEQAAKALGLDVRQSGSITRDRVLPGTGGFSPELLDALFGEDVRIGELRTAPVPAGAVLFEVTAREEFDPTGFESSRADLEQQITTQRRNQLLDEVLQRLRERYEIEINRQLVDSLDNIG